MEPGKCTQTELLQTTLEMLGYNVIVYHFPDYESETGKLIAKYLRGEYGPLTKEQKELIFILYASDRAKHAEDIRNYIANGYIVLLDRFTHSNVYNIAEYDEYDWDEKMEYLENLEFNCMHIPKPDYTLFLYVDPEITYNRCKERGNREYQQGKEDIYENDLDFIKKVSKCYKHFCDKNDNWFFINEMENGKQLPIEQVFVKVYEEVDKIL